MEIKKFDLASLKPLERNVRKHGDKQIEHFVESLKQFGQTRAFVVDEERNILVGNGMHAAMTAMGGWTKVDCHVVKGLSEREKQKLVLSDNRVFQLGSDDYGAIEEMLNEIASDGDYNIAGYDEEVLRSLARSTEEVMESMNNYGVLEEDEKPTTSKNATDSPYSDEVVLASVEPSEEFSTELDATERQETARRIVCPHCGGLVTVDA